MKERNFESLRELINSAIQIDKNREEQGRESLVADFSGLLTLKAKVDRYYSLLEIPEQEDDECIYYDGTESWDEYD